MSKLDPRIYKTLRSIDEALIALLQEYPFPKITIEMLCRKAGINRSTFYKYYTDKYALLERYLSRTLGEFHNTVRTDFVLAEPTHVGDRKYTELFRSTMEYLYENRKLYQILWNASLCRSVYDQMVDIVRDCIVEKSHKRAGREHYLQLFAAFFASNMMTLVQWWFQNEDKITMEEVVRIMHGSMEQGLFTAFKRLV